MSDLSQTIDTLLKETGFRSSPTAMDPMTYYYKGPLTMLVQPDTYGRTVKSEMDEGNDYYRGTYLSLVMKGPIRKDITDREYHNDLRKIRDDLNARLESCGTKISLAFVGLNGRRRLVVPNVLLEYRENTKSENVAASIMEVQEAFSRLLPKYKR